MNPTVLFFFLQNSVRFRWTRGGSSHPAVFVHFVAKFRGNSLEKLLNPHLVAPLLGEFSRENGHPYSPVTPYIVSGCSTKLNPRKIMMVGRKTYTVHSLKRTAKALESRPGFERRFHLPSIHVQGLLLLASGRMYPFLFGWKAGPFLPGTNCGQIRIFHHPEPPLREHSFLKDEICVGHGRKNRSVAKVRLCNACHLIRWPLGNLLGLSESATGCDRRFLQLSFGGEWG